MTERKIRQDTDFRVTMDQIEKLERALLELRESFVGSPDVLDAIAHVQYQEIVRLRTELDAVLGFSPEESSDLVVTLRGQNVGFGVVPSSVIATTLSKLKAAVQSVSLFWATGESDRGGRYPDWVSQSADFDFVGLTSGSVRINLKLPEPRTPLPEYGRESVEHSVHLILDTVDWISSGVHLDNFVRVIRDERLVRLLLTQVDRMTPSRRGVVQLIEFSGRLARDERSYILSPSSSRRISDALAEITTRGKRVFEEGKLRAADVDRGVFELRQRTDDGPNLRCRISEKILPQALNYLVRDVRVLVGGVQRFGRLGRPSYLLVDEIYES